MPIDHICQNPTCRIIFPVEPYKHRLGWRRYCSKSCRYAHYFLILPDRFWSFVARAQENECWLWTSRLTYDGYGVFDCHPLRLQRAHQVAYFLSKGPIPDGLYILHTRNCLSRACCNPCHLYAGTHAQNMADMAVTGGRTGITMGSRNGRAILTEEDIPQIRELLKTHTQYEVAALWHVSRSTIKFIDQRRTWTHVA